MTNLQRIFIATGMVITASLVDFCDAKALSIPEKESFLIAQTLGGIERKISLEEIPLPVMSSVKAATGAEPTTAGVELKSDGSLVYELAGKNQQGFEFEVEVTPSGKIIEVDEQIDRSAIPENVTRALRKWLPDAQIISSWRSTRLGEFVYEFVLEDFWLEISADGRKVIINQRERS
ncbi:MAG: hypothetical protein QNJ47_21230 [Nostocaceae cyanobacterium]|nr:hypothetical protein [Nostocaceae cyanobacterium]